MNRVLYQSIPTYSDAMPPFVEQPPAPPPAPEQPAIVVTAAKPCNGCGKNGVAEIAKASAERSAR